MKPTPLLRSAATTLLRSAALALLWLMPVDVWAQDDPARPALPAIAPREVEIRGQLEISFPSLERQPLVGFNPPPRVPTIPAGRRPFVEDYKQKSADLPPSPLQRPAPPAISTLAGLEPLNGEMEASLGRYFYRIVRGRLGAPLGARVGAYATLDYRGSDGHEPFDVRPQATSAFDDVSGEIGLKTTQEAFTAGFDVGGFYRDYALFGAQVSSNPALAEHPDRVGNSLGGGLWLRSQSANRIAFDGRLRYASTDFETQAFGPEAPLDPRFALSEKRVTFDGELSLPLGAHTLILGGTGSSAGLGPEASFGSDVTLVDGGARFRIRYGQAFNVTLGGRAISFDASLPDSAGTSVVRGRKTYVAPDVRLDFFPARGVTLYAQNRPRAEVNALADLYHENPYLLARPFVAPTVRTLDAEGGAKLFFGPVQVTARAGYQRMPNFLFFESATVAEADGYQGLAAARYAEAEVAHLGADLSVVLPGGLQATIGVAYRDGRLPDLDLDEIPYFSPVVGEAMLAYNFAGQRGLLQFTGTFESARFRDRDQTRELPDYLDFDAAFSYNFTPWAGVVVRAENLVEGQYLERWDRHPQAPFIVTGGLRILW